MKNLVKTLIIIFVVSYSTISFGQISVMNNKVAIGETWGLEPPYFFQVLGESYFCPDPINNVGLYITNTGSSGNQVVTLKPQFPSNAKIGTLDNEFHYVYTRYVYTTQVHTNTLFSISDKKVKKNIKPMDNALDKINKLNLVNFDYKDEYLFKNTDTSSSANEELKFIQENNNGFLAQDVEINYPKLVHYNKDLDLKEVNYIGFIPELVKSVQELSQEIENLKEENAYLKKYILNGDNNTNDSKAEKAKLYQNTPNPFNNDTKIEYYIPNTAINADIYIYNLNGTQIKHIVLSNKGQASYILSANNLEAGMYIYSLFVDGKEIDSKKMILTK
ncbi:MAG: tail fiber domain-containing protein [Bacteroidales bacterium]|jgi:hypothetical protein|nr:tail fiber domain-containing protein [Bacteroidales bacterium]